MINSVIADRPFFARPSDGQPWPQGDIPPKVHRFTPFILGENNQNFSQYHSTIKFEITTKKRKA